MSAYRNGDKILESKGLLQEVSHNERLDKSIYNYWTILENQ